MLKSEDKVLLPKGLSRAQRTELLNSNMRSVVPEICVERARLVTESYQQTEGEPYILRRAKALKYILENMTIFIDDEELIVGNHAAKARCAPLFPEFGLFSKEELDLMPVRKVDTLQISEENKKYILEVINPYWATRSTGERAKYYFSQSILEAIETPYRVFNPISRTRSGHGHYLPGVERILKRGFSGIEKDIKEMISKLDVLDVNYAEKLQFYQAALICIDGVKTFQKRYSDLASELAAGCNDTRRKTELLMIAQNCGKVPYEKADTYFEAVQSFWFTILIDYCGQNGSSISGGRVDQLFRSYYEKEVTAGILSREEAREILECLWIKHSDIIKACAFSSAKNNGGFSTANSIALGGLNGNGESAVCDFSYVCLDAEESVFNSEPNTSIRISSKTPNEFIERVVEILVKKEGGKMPLFNDDIIVNNLMKDGLSEEEALNYAIVGCVEPTGTGNTMGSTNAGFFNLAKCFELALFDGKCPLSGEQLGLHTGHLAAFTSFKQICDAFCAQMEYFASQMMCSLNCTEKLIGDYGQHIFSSLLLDGCIEQGKDCTHGGAKYNYIGIQGVGAIDVADSLTAIRKAVFEDKVIALKDLEIALKDNFDKDQNMRQYLLNQVPKYGNDQRQADEMVAWVVEKYCRYLEDKPTIRGGHFRPGLFCLSSNTPLGKQVGALPSGRLSRTPLADGGISPKHNMDVSGPTAAAKSVASIPQYKGTNGVNYNMKFLPSLLKGKEERIKFVDFIRTYLDLGGMHIQFNILSREKLLAAQAEPEKYRNLVVRVAGYSAFFVELDRDIQNEIISRTEYGILS